jgi:hypothetical protein
MAFWLDAGVSLVEDVRRMRTDLSVEEFRLGCFLILILNKSIQ